MKSIFKKYYSLLLHKNENYYLISYFYRKIQTYLNFLVSSVVFVVDDDVITLVVDVVLDDVISVVVDASLLLKRIT